VQAVSTARQDVSNHRAHSLVDTVLGRPIYTADQIPDDALWVRVVRSKYPHARVTRIDTSKALRTPGVVAVLTAKDIPGHNLSYALLPDRPLLATRKVRCLGDAVALVVGTDEAAAGHGIEEVVVDYEPLPAVMDVQEALKPGAPKLFSRGNLLRYYRVRKGDVKKGFAESDAILEDTYSTPVQDAMPVETECAFAIPRDDGHIAVTGTIQNPFHAREVVCDVLWLPAEKVDIIVPAIGGTFGVKSDEGALDVSAMAALAAMKTGKTAACAYKRDESTLSHSHRHSSVVKCKFGATKDGALKAAEVVIYFDTGAYASSGPLVLARGLVHATGPYQIPNVKVDGYLVYTNNLPAGAFRGFGNPQVLFAAESHIDALAKKLGISPLDLRFRNFLRKGSSTATGQVLDDSVSLSECLQKIADRMASGKESLPTNGPIKRGRGFAAVYHGNSLGIEGLDKTSAIVTARPDGTFGVSAGFTEYGQWCFSTLAGIAAKHLGVSNDRVTMERVDTDHVPDSGGPFASRTTLMGGNAVRLAAIKLRQRIQTMAAEYGVVIESEDDLVEFMKTSMKEAISEQAEFALPPCDFDLKKGHGTPYLQYTYGAVGVEVDVSTETGAVSLRRVVTAFDVGASMNLGAVVSQIEGAATQGIGFGMTEEFALGRNRLLTADFANYLVPSSVDVPSIEVVVVENPSSATPLGTRSIGEPPLEGPGPAIANAVYDAVGVRVRSLPITAQKVLHALKGWQS
jgi:CO/xanthine dehydrogenase Mo-binding subunit